MDNPTVLDLVGIQGRLLNRLKEVEAALSRPEAAPESQQWSCLHEDMEQGYILLSYLEGAAAPLSPQAVSLASQSASFLGHSSRHMALLDQAIRRRTRYWRVLFISGAVVLAMLVTAAVLFWLMPMSGVQSFFDSVWMTAANSGYSFGVVACFSMGVVLMSMPSRRWHWSVLAQRTAIVVVWGGILGTVAMLLAAAFGMVTDKAEYYTQSFAIGLGATYLVRLYRRTRA